MKEEDTKNIFNIIDEKGLDTDSIAYQYEEEEQKLLFSVFDAIVAVIEEKMEDCLKEYGLDVYVDPYTDQTIRFLYGDNTYELFSIHGQGWYGRIRKVDNDKKAVIRVWSKDIMERHKTTLENKRRLDEVTELIVKELKSEKEKNKKQNG